MLDFTGKSVIVTGAGSGIGRSTAILLAEAGALITIADKNDRGAQETLALIEKEGGRAQHIHTDVSKEADVEKMVERAAATFGHLFGAANVAGIPGCAQPLTDLTLEQWQRGIDINLTGVFLCLKYEIRSMLKSGRGSIVNISSTAAVKGFPNHGEYCAAKAGILSLTRTAAYETGRTGIRVNTVLPGVTDTPMFRSSIASDPALEGLIANQHLLGRFGQPVELGRAIRWLLSEEASFITGASIPVDGGQSAN